MLYELSRVLRTLSMRETGAVIITSAVDDVFLNHTHECFPTVELGTCEYSNGEQWVPLILGITFIEAVFISGCCERVLLRTRLFFV